jgi:predicted transcriptional regulator
MNIEELFHLARKKGISIGDISQSLGLHYSSVHNWHMGYSKPTPENFKKLKDFIKKTSENNLLKKKE